MSVCLYVCVCICPQVYLRSHWSKLHQNFPAYVAVARFFSSSVAICYVHPVLRVMLGLHAMTRNRRRKEDAYSI